MLPQSDPANAPTGRRYAVFRKWSVAGLGVGLLVASLGYFSVRTDFGLAGFVRFAIPIAVSLFVMALGVWIRTSAFPADLVNDVFLWGLAGGIVMGLLSGWTALLHSSVGGSMLQPASVVLTKVAVGVLGGGLLGVYHGRLQQRTVELAEQRDRLDEFAGIVSHDLRNPMNVAQGHLELARETGDERHFTAVEDAHDRMYQLVEEVLSLARRGDTVAEPSPVPLSEVATDAWATVETPGMDLRVETDRTVISDDRRLRSLFENLFRNAVEHGSASRQPSADDAVEHGSTSNRPRAGDAADRGGETVVVGDIDEGFYVADDGPGIPPDDRERIFEGGYSTRPNGTGFGLAIVRRIAEAHDWRIRVTESESGGARFEFVGADEE